MGVNVITVSSKGQISLPAEIRKELSIVQGDRFAAYASGDTIILKKVQVPTEEEFKHYFDELQEWAASVGYKEDDVNDIIKEVRKRNRE